MSDAITPPTAPSVPSPAAPFHAPSNGSAAAHAASLEALAGAAGRTLFVEGATPMVLFDPGSLRVLAANAAACRRYDYDAATFATLTLRDLRLPSEVPHALGQMPRDPDGRVRGGPFRHRTRTGTLIDVEVHVHDVAPAGLVPGATRVRVAALHDVTERLRAEGRQRFLSEVSSVLAASLDVQRTLESIAELAIAHLADGCTVHLRQARDDAPDALALLTVASRDPERAGLLRQVERRVGRVDLAAVGPAAALRSGRPELYDVPADAIDGEDGMVAFWRRLGVRSCLCVPLRAPDGVLGVISLASLSGERAFGAADLPMAEELARHAVLALENARLYTAERDARRLAERLAERSARLQSLTASLSAALTPTEVADVVVWQGIAALGARAGSVALLDAEAGTLDVVQARGYAPDHLAAFLRIPLDSRFPLTDAVRAGRPVWLLNVEERDRRYPNLAALRRANGGGAMAAVPLVVEDRIVGALGLNFPEGRDVEEDDRAFVHTLAAQCAQALERARLYEAERRARAAIEAARLEAEAANRTKTEFLAVMSHELRTPLNAIAGYVELLELGLRGPLTDAQREDLGRVRRNQRHLLGLINDVLNFAKLETGAVRYEIVEMPLREVVEAVEALVAPQVRQRRLTYAVEPYDTALRVRADRDKLQQILVNLLSNAVKFTEPGGTITLAAERVDVTVRLRVRDTGCGIPPDRQASVFEPFVQLDQRLTRTSEGTGLGLAISRDLARAMGGEITLTSAPGAGSVFTVELPGA